MIFQWLPAAIFIFHFWWMTVSVSAVYLLTAFLRLLLPSSFLNSKSEYSIIHSVFFSLQRCSPYNFNYLVNFWNMKENLDKTFFKCFCNFPTILWLCNWPWKLYVCYTDWRLSILKQWTSTTGAITFLMYFLWNPCIQTFDDDDVRFSIAVTNIAYQERKKLLFQIQVISSV